MLLEFLVCAVSCAAQSSSTPRHEKLDDLQEAVFIRGVYPASGNLPVLNRKAFRATRVSISEHPYVVSIRRLHAHYLTGTILSPHVLITVAHPLYNVPLNELGVVSGENYNDRGSVYMTVLMVLIHAEFDPYSLLADLALMRIFEGIISKATQKPIPIFIDFRPEQKYSVKTNKRTDQFAQKAFVTGWGRCDWMGTELCLPRSSLYFPDEKQDPMLQTISFNHSLLEESPYCVGYDINLIAFARTKGLLCVGPAREEQPLAPCLAVPGAPLTVVGRLAGVQSWGFSCGYTHDLPTVFTDVRYFRSWIQKNMGILESLNQDHVSELYIATKAFIIRDWLMQTSVQMLSVGADHGQPLRTIDLDKELIHLKGNLTDIRDFAYGGKLRHEKADMHASLKEEFQRKQKLAKITEKLRTASARPFVNDEFSDLIRNNGRYLFRTSPKGTRVK